MISTWINLAWKEFWLPFYHWKKDSSCPGGRDFLWLTVFLSLLLTLSLMMFASSEGVLNRFVDVLLGKKPEFGVPVWITPNILSRSGINLIDSKVLDEIEQLGFKVAPYRDIEAGFDTYVNFPGGKEVWGRVEMADIVEKQKIASTTVTEDFKGWAVYHNDPLWHVSREQAEFPLTVILNKTLFSRNFNYQEYRREVNTHLPSNLTKSLPERLPPIDLDLLESMWLKLRVGGRNEFVLFDIVWVDYIHTVEKIAFLFPLTTYHAVQHAYRYPTLNYFPETHGKEGLRIRQIRVEGNPAPGKIQQFVTAMNAEIVEYRGDVLIKFDRHIPESLVSVNALEHNIKFEKVDDVTSDILNHTERVISLPCGRIPREQLVTLNIDSLCINDKHHNISLDVTANGNGFSRSIVYIPDRNDLFGAVDKLLKIREGAISIHPVYQDALNKFAFLTRMIEAMRKPFGFVLLISLIALVGIQLFTLVGHRRHRYGMFLSKGFEWWQIYLMMLFQITMALSVGAVVAISIIHIARIYLEQVIRVVAVEYKETLSLVDLDLIPLSINDYLLVSTSILLMSYVLALQVLYFMPLRQRTHPASLFQQ